MSEPEIILNLWYLFDDRGVIYSLRARAYVQSGSDEEKLRFLHSLAERDYMIARPFPVPERFHTTVVDEDGQWKVPVMTMQILETQGGFVSVADLFEEAVRAIERDLPGQTKLSIPKTPLTCLTPLFVDDEGNIQPRISRQKGFD
jgi:hypothetical protein